MSYDSDTERALSVMQEVALAMWKDDAWAAAFVEEPEVWGVEDLGTEGVLIRLAAKTKPLMQWRVGRELRRRVKAAFDAEGIQIASAQRMILDRPDDGPGETADADVRALEESSNDPDDRSDLRVRSGHSS